MGRQIPVRTYSEWNWPPPGFLEIDLVAYCGGTLSGSFIHSLVATDFCTGWTEAVPLLAREQSWAITGPMIAANDKHSYYGGLTIVKVAQGYTNICLHSLCLAALPLADTIRR